MDRNELAQNIQAIMGDTDINDKQAMVKLTDLLK